MEVRIIKYRNIKGINDLLCEYTKYFYEECYNRKYNGNMYLEYKKDVYLIKSGKNTIGAFILKHNTVYSLFINKEYRGKDIVRNVLEFSRNICNHNIEIGAISGNIPAIKCYSKYCEKSRPYSSDHWFLYKGEKEFITIEYVENMFKKMEYLGLCSAKIKLEEYICEFKIDSKNKYYASFICNNSGKKEVFKSYSGWSVGYDIRDTKYYKMEIIK